MNTLCTKTRLLVRARSLSSSGVAREIRLAAGLSLNEMANTVGFSPATLWRYENARARVSARYARAYARALDELSPPEPSGS
jgi:transcriptional regulator with XRE-family HTH domain